MNNESTRPDPKVQIAALFDIGRVMVEMELPALRVAVELDGTVSLTLYDGPEHPVSAEYAAEVVAAWASALGFSEPWAQVDGCVRYASVHGVWAGMQVDLRTSGRIAAVPAVTA